ncbi:MAG: fasciclin domain-containing protein, partial [Jaaginema sp. PMC 1079.18]|nr:fasciclin domain-containing protein [Jaaginema sp. PMC 1079.18]
TLQLAQNTPNSTPNDSTTPNATPSATPNSTLVDVATNDDRFDTLSSAVKAAGLEDTLSGDEPYTVFAPTDEAFDELPDGVVDALLKPENRDLLRDILMYHVVPGNVTAEDLETGPVDTLNGGLSVRVDPDKVVVNNGSVVEPDIKAGNGVVHAVNRVMIPPAAKNRLAALMPVRGLW